tara:strand:- start:305 stop:892 length:588 start_codon:yes stop_codon:yes gene_type:complete
MLPPILQRLEYLGHRVFDGGHAYNLNIVGIRAHETRAGSFDDLITVTYRQVKNGPWITEHYQATTDPSAYWLNNPMAYGGTAILKTGQWRGCFELGKHRGKYEALTQAKPVTVHRDNTLDDILDFTTETAHGLFGINIHRAGERSTQVGKWSAGCQVIAAARDFQQFMDLAHAQIDSHPSWPSRFTYTLIKDWMT